MRGGKIITDGQGVKGAEAMVTKRIRNRVLASNNRSGNHVMERQPCGRTRGKVINYFTCFFFSFISYICC